MAPRVTTIVSYDGEPAPRQMRLISWRSLGKGSLRRFHSIEQVPLSLRIIDCPIGQFPAALVPLACRLRVDDSGRKKLMRTAGLLCAMAPRWRNRERGNCFSVAFILSIRRSHSGAFGEDAL